MAEVFFMIIMTIAIGMFGERATLDVIYTIYLTIIFGIQLFIRFLLINEKGDWIFFLFGVIAGGGNDLMSMINGVYMYTSISIIPFLSGLLPLWMILFWGQIFLLFRKIFNLPWFKEEFKKNGEFLNGWVDKTLILDLSLIVMLRIIIYNTYMLDFWIPALFYAIGVGVRFLIFKPKKSEVLIMVILPYAFLFEALMVVFGLYVYYNPVPIFLMPLWLLIWWVFLVPIVLKELFERFEYYINPLEGNSRKN